MDLYLDDDTADHHLIALLRRAGHAVSQPSDFGMAGEEDARHLIQSARSRLVVLTRNHADFELLHELLIACGGRHSGILTIRFDNDRSRDMKPRDIVSALRKLEQSGAVIANELHVLNHWR